MHCTHCEFAKYHDHAAKHATGRATPHRTLLIPLVAKQRERVHVRNCILTFLTEQVRHRYKQ